MEILGWILIALPFSVLIVTATWLKIAAEGWKELLIDAIIPLLITVLCLGIIGLGIWIVTM